MELIMPTYTFKNIRTGEITEKFMKMSDKDQYMKDNPDLERHLCDIPKPIDPVRLGVKKPAEGFRDLLKTIKKNTGRRSKVNTF